MNRSIWQSTKRLPYSFLLWIWAFDNPQRGCHILFCYEYEHLTIHKEVAIFFFVMNMSIWQSTKRLPYSFFCYEYEHLTIHKEVAIFFFVMNMSIWQSTKRLPYSFLLWIWAFDNPQRGCHILFLLWMWAFKFFAFCKKMREWFKINKRSGVWFSMLVMCRSVRLTSHCTLPFCTHQWRVPRRINSTVWWPFLYVALTNGDDFTDVSQHWSTNVYCRFTPTHVIS